MNYEGRDISVRVFVKVVQFVHFSSILTRYFWSVNVKLNLKEKLSSVRIRSRKNTRNSVCSVRPCELQNTHTHTVTNSEVETKMLAQAKTADTEAQRATGFPCWNVSVCVCVCAGGEGRTAHKGADEPN